MTDIPTWGSPAQLGVRADEYGRERNPFVQGGMTLRDYFAASALTGILACDRDYDGARTSEARAEYAYRCADLMLEARK